ncbi:hypothetical protein KJ865_15950, partial [Myxococcota bacterium]|nr:hypothetical protein [Myxococcota bacterium]
MLKSLFPIILLVAAVLGSCKKPQKVIYYSKSYYTMKSTPFGKANFFTESRTVTAIQITEGAVWVGTNKGLLQFGHDFSVKQIMTKNEGLPSNNILALAWQGDTLFAGTSGGLAVFSHGSWQNKSLPMEGRITSLAATDKGGIWVGLNSGLVFHAFGRFLVYKKGVHVTTLKISSDGKTYVGTEKSGLWRCEQGSCSDMNIGLTSVTALESHGKSLWIAGKVPDGSGKIKLISGSKRYTYVTDDPIDWLQSFKDSIMFYSGGSVYNMVPCAMKSAKGFKLKAKGTAPCYFANINSTKFPPKMTVVTQARNYLWVGTGSLGVARFDG